MNSIDDIWQDEDDIEDFYDHTPTNHSSVTTTETVQPLIVNRGLIINESELVDRWAKYRVD